MGWCCPPFLQLLEISLVPYVLTEGDTGRGKQGSGKKGRVPISAPSHKVVGWVSSFFFKSLPPPIPPPTYSPCSKSLSLHNLRQNHLPFPKLDDNPDQAKHDHKGPFQGKVKKASYMSRSQFQIASSSKILTGPMHPHAEKEIVNFGLKSPPKKTQQHRDNNTTITITTKEGLAEISQ